MHIALQTTGVDHVTLRSADLARAHGFYGERLGLPIVLETWDSFVALAGSTALVIRGQESRAPSSDASRSRRVGVDRIALGCESQAELERVAAALVAANVPSTRLRADPVLQRRYVAFTDPDGTTWEVCMALTR